MKRVLLMGLVLLLITPMALGAADEIDQDEKLNKEKTETVQPGTETEIERSKVYMKMGEITVTGEADFLTTADAPASVDVIGSDQIEMENVDFSMELMKKVPGVYYGDWNQGVTAGSISMRGFDTFSNPPISLIVDGIPHNRVSSMDIQPFLPLEIDHMEVVKGTSDPRYGLLNLAGNVNLHTKQGGNFTQARLLVGSYDTYDASVIIGKEDENFSQTYFAGYRQTDGYREHSDLKKGAASGKWFYTNNDKNLKVGVIARFFSMDANAPGYLTKEQAANNPTQAAEFALSDGGEQDNQHVSAHMDYYFTDQLAWSFKTYFQHIERVRWARWSLAGSQSERLNVYDQYGAVSTLTYEIYDTFIPKLKIDWGVDYQLQDYLNQRWTTDNRVRQGTPYRDWDSSYNYLGSYVQTDADVTNWLRLVGALRVDVFDGEMTNQQTGLTTDMVDLDYIWQPKVGVIITPWEGYNFYANYGRAFQPPSIPGLFGQSSGGSTISRDIGYSKNDGWELGIKVSPYTWLSARIDYWEMIASDEVRSKNDGSGDYINAGETTRKGMDFSLSIRPHDWVSLWGSYSLIDAKYTDPGPGLEDIRGNDIETIPAYSAKLGIDFSHPSGFFSSLSAEFMGDYEINAANTREKDGNFNVWNWSVGYKWEKATIGFDVKNIFDESYNSFIWDNDNGYNPGDGRSCYLWVSVDY